MGLYDRDYGRAAEQTPWDRAQNPRSMTITLVVINVVLFFVDMIINQHDVLVEWFGASATTVTRPWMIWQTLTYGFLHDNGINHILFNMFGLFIFGRPVEQKIGGKEFLRFYLTAVVVGGLIAALYAIVMGDGAVTIGASGGVVAVTILFACYFPNVELLFMFLFPVKAWVLAVCFVALDLGGAASAALGFSIGGNTAYVVHVTGAAFALLYYFRNWNFGFLSGAGGAPDIMGRLRAKSRRMKLKLHDPDQRLAKDAEEADRILAKIHASGESSLTASERRTLERYSRRQRERRDR